MSDFSEKQDLNEQEENSTVFSNPEKYEDKRKNNAKLLPKIIAAVAALAILAGGTLAVVKFIPVLEDDDGTSSTAGKTITVKDLKADKISSVTVTNAIGVTEFYSETEQKTEATSSSGTEAVETVTWYTKQADKALTSSSAIESVISTVADIKATMEITKKTADECGLAKPTVKAVVTPKSEASYTVLLGAESPDKSGYYLQLEGDDKVYLVASSVYTKLEFELLDFADKSTIPGVVNVNNELDSYYEEGSLSTFDRLEVSGGNFEDKVVIVPNTNGEISRLMKFLVISPQKLLAQNIETMLSLYQGGISVTGAYSYDVSPASLKKFGLDKPDIQTKLTIKNHNITFRFTKQEDGNYAVIGDNSKLIYSVTHDMIADIADLEATDFYTSVIFMNHIDDIANFKVQISGEEYSFDISKNAANEDGEEPEEKYNVVLNGKTVKSQNFQNYYGNCLSLSIIDFKSAEVNAEPKVTFIVTNNNSDKTVVEFVNVNANRYLVRVNGVPVGKITASSLDKIIELTKDVANGKEVKF